MTDSNTSIVRAFLAAAAAGDKLAMARLAAPDLVVIEAESLPYAGRHVGLDAFLALVARVFGAWLDTRVAVERFIAEGDHVVVVAALHGRSRHDNAALEMPIAEIWRVEGGTIREIRPFYFDTHRMLGLMGQQDPDGQGHRT